MQTNINENFSALKEIGDIESILRSCVHCGFCTATCPTYQLLGDELDSPRGRIYLIKNFLEGGDISESTQRHLDRCLSCRSCETTCPSGVRYARLLDFGRKMVERQLPRTVVQRLFRAAIRMVVPYPNRVIPILKGLRFFRPLFPESIRLKIPTLDEKSNASEVASRLGNEGATQARKIVLFEGCVQSVLAQSTNNALREIFQKKNILSLSAPKAGCCSALCQHLSDEETSQQQMKANIDAWWPLLEEGAEAIIISASGCAAHIKEYPHLLQFDSNYAEKARRVGERVFDASEFLLREFHRDRENGVPWFESQPPANPNVSFHSPCTLQHGQKLVGVVETLLENAGYQLNEIEDSHICCGSAGSYSLLQPKLSKLLLRNKLNHLQRGKPHLIATANIGCQLHLQSNSQVPVLHWVQLIAGRLR